MTKRSRWLGKWVLLVLLSSPVLSWADQVRLSLYTVERTRTLAVPTHGLARVILLNPVAVEVRSISDTEVVFAGLRIDSSIVHLWDRSGRRTLRIAVVELASILREQREREREALRRKLGLPERSLKLQYRGTHRHLDRGQNESLRGTDEQYRVRTHDWKARMGLPIGLLAADTYLESRRDTTLGKEVTQARHLSLALQKFAMGPLGKVDLVAGDRDVNWSDFTLPGRRYRGLGLFPSGTDLFGRTEPREGLSMSLFAGEERQGYGLDLQAGTQSRQARSRLAGLLLEYPLFKDLRVHATGLHREGKSGQFKSDHVYEVGFNWDWQDLVKLDLDAARNGPQGAYQADLEIDPLDNVRVRNRLWRIGKDYRTVTGTVARHGQTGWRNNVAWTLPYWDDAVTLSSTVNLYRDRSSLNPVNPREWNTLYALDSSARLPREFTLHAGVSHADESGNSFPSVTRRLDTKLSRSFTVGAPWLQGFSPYVAYSYSDFGKSASIPGYDGTLDLLRTGVRVNLWKGLWGGASLSQGWLKEHEPESELSETRPKEFILEGGGDHAFTFIPAHLNLVLRYVDVKNTLNKTHQPFSDQNQLSGNLRFTWKLGPEREWFTSFSASRQIPETQPTTNPLVEFFLETGLRLAWDTKWAPGQSGSVTGFVFRDLNANGRRDPEEPGIQGVRVYAADGPSAQTGAGGGYTLRGVPEGPVLIKVDWDQIPPANFFTTANTVEELILPRKKASVDFGVSTESEFRGIVFSDMDADRLFTEGVDLPVQGVRLSMETGQSAVSGPTGHYSIRRVPPGPRTIAVEISSIPDGYQTLIPIRKSAETKEADVLQFDVPLRAQRTVAGSVFLDANLNGIRDDPEAGVGGVMLELGPMSVRTDPDGRYRISDLEPGSRMIRIVKESIPSGCFLRFPESIEILVPQGAFLREPLNFSLSTEPGPPVKPQRWEPEPAPQPEAPEPAVEEPPAPAEPVKTLSPEEERLHGLLEEIIPPGFTPQVVDQALADRFPEIAALARMHPVVVIDRSETYEQALALVMQLAYRDATYVHYYEETFRSGWFRRAAPEATLQIIPIQPKGDLLSLLAQILANASGASENTVAEQVDLDSLAEELRQ